MWNILQKKKKKKLILGHETTLNKFKSTEIISTIFSKYSSIKLEINYTKKTEKFTNIWRLNFVPLKNQWVRGRNQRNQRILWKQWKWKYNRPKLMCCSKSSSKREVFYKYLHQETAEISDVKVIWLQHLSPHKLPGFISLIWLDSGYPFPPSLLLKLNYPAKEDILPC